MGFTSQRGSSNVGVKASSMKKLPVSRRTGLPQMAKAPSAGAKKMGSTRMSSNRGVNIAKSAVGNNPKMKAGGSKIRRDRKGRFN